MSSVISVYILTYISKFVIEKIHLFVIFLIYVISAHVYYLLYINKLSFVYITSILIVLACAVAVQPYSFKSRNSLLWYLGFLLVSTIIISVIVDAPQMNTTFFLLTIITWLAISYVSLPSHLNTLGKLRESEERYRYLVESSPEAIAVHSSGKIVYVNPAGIKLLNAKSSDDIIGKSALNFVHPDYHEIVKQRISKIYTEQKQVDPIEEKFIRLDGQVIDVEVTVMPITYLGKQAVQVIIKDITQRKLAEEQIKVSLKEKEVLLREIHHRVKNNLQIISSLLDLQVKHLKDKQIIEPFKESQNRIKSMALTHEMLYQSKNIAKIDFYDYVKKLVVNLSSSYKINTKDIALKINIDSVFVNVDIAIPCGLILNELVSNALKHAFPPGKVGEVSIDFYYNNDVFILTVSDNGIGLPKNLDIQNTESLGLKLVHTLINQLEGTMEINRNYGTKFIIRFPELKYKEKA
jgi:PAS domain S-box-containing protein